MKISKLASMAFLLSTIIFSGNLFAGMSEAKVTYNYPGMPDYQTVEPKLGIVACENIKVAAKIFHIYSSSELFTNSEMSRLWKEGFCSPFADAVRVQLIEYIEPSKETFNIKMAKIRMVTYIETTKQYIVDDSFLPASQITPIKDAKNRIWPFQLSQNEPEVSGSATPNVARPAFLPNGCAKDDLKCLAEKGSGTAAVYCRRHIENLSKNAVQWTEKNFSLRFARMRWLDKENGQITYIGDRVQFQNGFGAFVNMIYECDVDKDGKTVLGVNAEPGRLSRDN